MSFAVTTATATAPGSSPTAGKYSGPPLTTGGLSDALLDAIGKAALPPPELSIGELLLWMQTTMEKTDKAIRDKMNGMVADQEVTKKYTDAIAALDKMEIDAKSGGSAVVSPEFYAAMDDKTLANVPDNVRTALVHWNADYADDNQMAPDTIAELRDALKDAITAKNSSHEMQMIELQSDVSSRQQKFQMVSAIAHSLDETASQIISKF
jgi:hypothetical protein